jgi:hypothetical protein
MRNAVAYLAFVVYAGVVILAIASLAGAPLTITTPSGTYTVGFRR